jgi:hypothetical protein
MICLESVGNGTNSKSKRPPTAGGSNPAELVERCGSSERKTSPEDANASARIAHLENALKLAEEEKAILRRELEKTKHHGQIYAGNKDDYIGAAPGTCSRSPSSNSPRNSSEMEYEVDERFPHSSSTKNEDATEQNYRMREETADLHEKLAEAVLRANELQGRKYNWDSLTRQLHHAEKESQDRLRQLLDLKQSISAMTRMESQLTDSELVDMVEQLFHRVREWVITNFRRSTLCLKSAPDDVAAIAKSIYPQYAAINPSERLSFYQAIVVNALMAILCENVGVGLPASGPLASLRQVATHIQDTGPAYSEWRRATIRALERSEANHTLRQEREAMLHRLTADIEQQLASLTSTKLTPNARASLLSILQTAADLQHSILLQRARYQLRFFRPQASERLSFDPETMESVNEFDDDLDGDDSARGRTFSFCVFPCLEKYGDEFGENTHVRNVLLRAKVCSRMDNK